MSFVIGLKCRECGRVYPKQPLAGCEDDGKLRRFINIYVDGEDIRFLDNLSTRVPDGAELSIILAIAGG